MPPKQDKQGRLIWGVCPRCQQEVSASHRYVYVNSTIDEPGGYICNNCGNILWVSCRLYPRCLAPAPHQHKIEKMFSKFGRLLTPKTITSFTRVEELDTYDVLLTVYPWQEEFYSGTS